MTTTVDKSAPQEGVALRASSSALLACTGRTYRTIVVPDDIYEDFVQALPHVGLHLTTVLRAGKDTPTLRRIPSWLWRKAKSA